MKNFLLIGFGNLGKHYYTAFNQIQNCNIDIWEIKQIENQTMHNTKILENLGSIKRSYDLAVIAVGAHNQLSVLNEINTISNIRNIILEKNISQFKQDLIYNRKLLKKCYVNIWFTVSEILPLLLNLNLKIYNIEVKVPDKTLLSNTIHYIYFIIKMAQSNIANLEFNSETDQFFKTKRLYAAEIMGEFQGKTLSGVKFSIECLPTTIGPTTIVIKTYNNGIVTVNLDEHEVTLNNNTKIKFSEWLVSKDFKFVISDLLKGKRINLPRADEVAINQLIIYEAIEKKFGERKKIPFA